VRLADGLQRLIITDRQGVLRLVVRDVLIGGDNDITIRHSIPPRQGITARVAHCAGAVSGDPRGVRSSLACTIPPLRPALRHMEALDRAAAGRPTPGATRRSVGRGAPAGW
jgi:hypothetical protein